MQRFYMLVAGMAILAFAGFAQPGPAGPYKVVKTVKVGGAGGYDYVYADVDGRRLYIPRPGGSGARITVFDLPTPTRAAWRSILNRITASAAASRW
jgi:hypothetical protein